MIIQLLLKISGVLLGFRALPVALSKHRVRASLLQKLDASEGV